MAVDKVFDTPFSGYITALRRTAVIVFISCSLACGQTGPLVLPDPQAEAAPELEKEKTD